MLKNFLLIAYLIVAGVSLLGCETTEQLQNQLTTPFEPIVSPVDDTVQEIVKVHEVEPMGIKSTVSLAEKRQIRVAF